MSAGSSGTAAQRAHGGQACVSRRKTAHVNAHHFLNHKCRGADAVEEAGGAGGAAEVAAPSVDELQEKLAMWEGLLEQLDLLTSRPNHANSYVLSIKNGGCCSCGVGPLARFFVAFALMAAEVDAAMVLHQPLRY